MDSPSKLRPTRQAEQLADERSVSAIVGELWHSTETLLRQELQLGLAHVDKRTDELKAALLAATMSGALLYAGLLAIVASVIMLVAKFIDPWLSALIVGLAVSGVGYAIMPREVTKRDADEAAPSAAFKNKSTFKETRT